MISYIKAVCFEGFKVIRDWLADKEMFLARMYIYIKCNTNTNRLSQRKGHFLEIFISQVAKIILP